MDEGAGRGVSGPPGSRAVSKNGGEIISCASLEGNSAEIEEQLGSIRERQEGRTEKNRNPKRNQLPWGNDVGKADACSIAGLGAAVMMNAQRVALPDDEGDVYEVIEGTGEVDGCSHGIPMPGSI